jgi:N-acetylglutamate synthase-like GNAT family acetyltransferase
MYTVRQCHKDECSAVSEIINAAAEAYRGVIPADRWHDPYMSLLALESEISAGVGFWACESEGDVIGVMGIQPVRDVDLIRHAYVRPGYQRRGIGAALISHIRSMSSRQMLVGTWAAATWAIAFYQRHGFELVSAEQRTALLRKYWTIPERQIETSVVLANPPLAS